jgi:hypothetical protein
MSAVINFERQLCMLRDSGQREKGVRGPHWMVMVACLMRLKARAAAKALQAAWMVMAAPSLRSSPGQKKSNSSTTVGVCPSCALPRSTWCACHQQLVSAVRDVRRKAVGRYESQTFIRLQNMST